MSNARSTSHDPVRINPTRAVRPVVRQTFAALRRLSRQGVVTQRQAVLADRWGCSERTVRDHLRELEQAGWIVRQSRPVSTGGRLADVIILTGMALPRHAQRPRPRPNTLPLTRGQVERLTTAIEQLVMLLSPSPPPVPKPPKVAGSIHILSVGTSRSDEKRTLPPFGRKGRASADAMPRRQEATMGHPPSQPTLFPRRTSRKIHRPNAREQDLSAFKAAYVDHWGLPYRLDSRQAWMRAMHALKLVAQREPNDARRHVLLAEYARLDDPWLREHGHPLMVLTSDMTWRRVVLLAEEEWRQREQAAREADEEARWREDVQRRQQVDTPERRVQNRLTWLRVLWANAGRHAAGPLSPWGLVLTWERDYDRAPAELQAFVRACRQELEAQHAS